MPCVTQGLGSNPLCIDQPQLHTLAPQNLTCTKFQQAAAIDEPACYYKILCKHFPF